MLDRVSDKAQNGFNTLLASKEKLLLAQISKLDALSPTKTLLRGYAVAEKDGNAITSVSKINVNDKISVRFSDGSAECTVDNFVKE